MDILLNWLDLFWLPFVFLLTAKRHWIKATALVLACVISLRFQIDLMREIGQPNGFLPFLDTPLLYRGYVVYGIFIGAFLGLSHFARRENNYIYLAAAISLYIFAFIVSTIALLL